MIRQCAWCGRDLDDAGERMDGAGVSHGICLQCGSRVSEGAGTPIAEFVAALDEPVLLLDADHTVGVVNDPALGLVGKQAGNVLGERAGTVFECENAHLPGGCGPAIHCSGCTIRQAVAHTHLTGEPRRSVRATLRVVDDPDLTDVELVISTVRVGSRVLLQVEDFNA